MCKSRCLGEIWSYTKIDQLLTKTTKNQTNQRLVRYCVNPNVSVKFGFTQKWTKFSQNLVKQDLNKIPDRESEGIAGFFKASPRHFIDFLRHSNNVGY